MEPEDDAEVDCAFASLTAEILNKIPVVDKGVAGNKKPMNVEEELDKVGGRALEQPDGKLKYRPCLLPVQIGDKWYTVLVDSGAGCSLGDEIIIDGFSAGGLLWGVWKALIEHEWGGLTKESTKTGHRIPGTEWAIVVVYC